MIWEAGENVKSWMLYFWAGLSRTIIGTWPSNAIIPKESTSTPCCKQNVDFVSLLECKKMEEPSVRHFLIKNTRTSHREGISRDHELLSKYSFPTNSFDCLIIFIFGAYGRNSSIIYWARITKSAMIVWYSELFMTINIVSGTSCGSHCGATYGLLESLELGAKILVNAHTTIGMGKKAHDLIVCHSKTRGQIMKNPPCLMAISLRSTVLYLVFPEQPYTSSLRWPHGKHRAYSGLF